MRQITPLFNAVRGHRFFDYEDGDALWRSSYPLSTATGLPEALDEAYGHFNADSRPNGRSETSVSVGDLLEVREAGGQLSYHAVESVGFRVVSAPTGLGSRPSDQ